MPRNWSERNRHVLDLGAKVAALCRKGYLLCLAMGAKATAVARKGDESDLKDLTAGRAWTSRRIVFEGCVIV